MGDGNALKRCRGRYSRRRGPARGTLHIVSKADKVEKVEKVEGAAVLNFGNVQNSGSWLPLLMKSESNKKATRGDGRRKRPETSPKMYGGGDGRRYRPETLPERAGRR